MPDIKAQNETALASVKAIYDAADEANTLLDGMQTAATQAGTTLNGIYADAESAKSSAENASEYASRALGNLASVQSVTETLNWITAHGTMTLTTDTALDPSHVYFVVDANGDYVVGGTHYSVVSEPVLADIGSYYELSINESLNNYVATHLVVDTEGLWIIPDSGGNKVLIATGSGSTYTTAGTYIINGSTVLASFTANGIQVGQTGESHLEMDYHSLKLVDRGGNTYFHVSDLRNAQGLYETVDTFRADFTPTTQYSLTYTSITTDYSVTVNGVEVTSGITKTTVGFEFDTAHSYPDVIVATYTTNSPNAKAFTFGSRQGNSTIGGLSVAEGNSVTASGLLSHAEGIGTYASGVCSHAEGNGTVASGYGSHVQGQSSEASGRCSHAIGESTIASGESSHAEGRGSSAGGYASHAEGFITEASGEGSHAEGNDTRAYGNYSHAEGEGTIAQRKSQIALGEYNIADTGGTDGTTRGDYVAIIGNGTSSARSNALTVDWSGNVVASGDVTDGNGITLSSLYHNGIIVVSSATFTSLPQTITYADITSEHVAVNWTLTNPSAQTGDWTVTTSNGSVTIDGAISGRTAITLYLAPTNTADKNGVLVVSDTITSLPKTITNADISVNHVLLNSVLSVPSLQTDDWTVTTSDGSVTITGTKASGSTDITLYLGNQTA